LFKPKGTRWIVPLLLALLIVPLISGKPNQEMRGTITETGSTTVYPLAKKLAEVFMERYPNVNVTTGETGSGEGIRAAAEGRVDIGAASRALKPNEPELHTHLIGRDGIAVIVHPSNPLEGLTMEQVVNIFSGRVSNWSQVGGTDELLTVVMRAKGSGTRAAFEDMVMGDSPVAEDAVIEHSNADVRTLVSINRRAIGYLSLGFIDQSITAVAIDGVACTTDNCRNDTYPIVRPLYFLTREEAAGMVKKFIDFSQSREGQSIVMGEGYLGTD
jgi:phosphate transport system substrate-binding protein